MKRNDFKLSLSNEKVIEYSVKRLKNKTKNASIKGELVFIIKSKQIKMNFRFKFKDINVSISGEVERTADFTNNENITYNVLSELIKEDWDVFAQPLFSKASKIVASLSEEIFIFPLIVPISEWEKNTQYSIKKST
ncbi:hypothetical protein [Staphylococcus hominis]|uniref:hypothetical protein n=1 Tax=Staphylococcus hominis TaxID=1290 RepID=UPI0034D3A50E